MFGFLMRKLSNKSHFYILPKIKPVQKAAVLPRSLYGGRHLVTMLPGEGIGPELMNYVKDVFRVANAPIDFETIQFDPKSNSDEDLKYAIMSVKRHGVAIKGNIETTSENPSILSRNALLRNELDLYVNVFNCKPYPGVQARQKNIDVVIIRQNTEGEYSMLEHESIKGVVESMKIITRTNSERVARYAFEFAKINGRKKVTTIHKADILNVSDGLFLETSRKVAKEYPEIKHEDMNINNCCFLLISTPQLFDVMLMTNLYGAIVSSVVSGLAGGVGLFSGKNYGEFYAVFEPAARSIGSGMVGQNIANPIAMLNASVDMLEHLEHTQHAKLIRNAIEKTLSEDRVHTSDLGGQAKTDQVIKNILSNIREFTGRR